MEVQADNVLENLKMFCENIKRNDKEFVDKHYGDFFKEHPEYIKYKYQIQLYIF